ncbi:MAG: NADH-quinone oxidoreductase subunit J [Bacteroidota bacterium]
MEITANQIMFIIFAFVIVLGSILTVTTRRILRAATFLLCVLISTAGLYFMLNFQFLAAVQLTLYAGGIVVLIIFSILLTSHISQKFEVVSWKKTILPSIAATCGFILTSITIINYKFPTESLPIPREASISNIGLDLMNYGRDGYALPFEVISVLLLGAMIGAIVIAKKQPKKN